ncbi:hypothetical protein I1A62_23010 [Rhodococcus sp. USK10]|uniref:hypothetical protein n=1 Tax=Rhodococcus sp. USK10 TaxID=2789739 RepID=UPI001C5E7FA9|nr:hypothetical protein [Rhodococcus sp. USK10]QYB07143.1 hypothetical protein I1A62_23010 [Rhodococcus sp. USK10]
MPILFVPSMVGWQMHPRKGATVADHLDADRVDFDTFDTFDAFDAFEATCALVWQPRRNG